MDTAWSITEFDLTNLNLRRRTSLREALRGLATTILIFIIGGIGIWAWNSLGLSIGPKSAHPWIVGPVVLTVASLMIVGMIDSTREKMGLETAANVSGRSTLDHIIADQPDPIGPDLGVSASEFLHTTNAILSGLKTRSRRFSVGSVLSSRSAREKTSSHGSAPLALIATIPCGKRKRRAG